MMKIIFGVGLLILFAIFNLCIGKKVNGASFQIDYENDRFLKDGQPFRYVSGTIHYFRVLPELWRDRLRKLRYSGCNAVQTYVEWRMHEPEYTDRGAYEFEKEKNLFKFLQIAQEEGLLVILRPGPYICAERDMGGFPYWLLLKKPTMRLRSSDPDYMYYVRRWFSVLLPKLKPFLYENGGSIIMAQIENEYGSYPDCDFSYTAQLRDMARQYLGENVLLFTTDGWITEDLRCGKVADVYATVDFGPETDAVKAFNNQRLFELRGPKINSEFYTGWLDHWGEPHNVKSAEQVSTALDKILSENASVNIYVFHGGTSFGLGAGANFDNGKFRASLTSYDYDAPISEAGDLTPKYFAIRNVIAKYLPVPSEPTPKPNKKYAYGKLNLRFTGSLLDIMENEHFQTSKWPMTFEELLISNGIALYQTNITDIMTDPATLTLFDVHDRAYVFVDKNYVGVVSRENEVFQLPIYARPNQTLSIVVEGQGRIGVGEKNNELKGITTNVTVGSKTLSDWKIQTVDFNTVNLNTAVEKLQQKNLGPDLKKRGDMGFYQGAIDIIGNPVDTFIRFDGWHKGYVFINGFLLGRYWPVMGPQITLYVPAPLLITGKNYIDVIELEKAPCSDDGSCNVMFTDKPEINGPTPAA